MQEAFEELNMKLTSVPVLAVPVFWAADHRRSRRVFGIRWRHFSQKKEDDRLIESSVPAVP